MSRLTFVRFDDGLQLEVCGIFQLDGKNVGGPVGSLEFARITTLSLLYARSYLSLAELSELETQILDTGVRVKMNKDDELLFSALASIGVLEHFSVQLLSGFANTNAEDDNIASAPDVNQEDKNGDSDAPSLPSQEPDSSDIPF